MEEGSFLKKVRDVRAQALAEEQAEQEKKLPSPPGMSIADVAAATADMLRIIEAYVLDAIRANPEDDDVEIAFAFAPMAFGREKTFRFSTKYVDGIDGCAWWSAICNWSDENFPKNVDLLDRYNSLTRQCLEVVRDMWNTAHPECPVTHVAYEAGDLTIQTPK